MSDASPTPKPNAAMAGIFLKQPLCLVLGVAIGSAVAGGLWASIAPQTLPSPLLNAVTPVSVTPIVDRLHPTLGRPVTIALLGIDHPPDLATHSPQRFEAHSDTIALIRFDPEARSIHLVSIPRDTRVEIPGYGFDKINRANLLGGGDLTIASLEGFLTGVTIDRRVRVDIVAARQVIDQLGGLELRVDQPMQYIDRTQNLTIQLESGWQWLDGAQTIEFARYREDGLGDIGRVQRQQQVFDAILSRLRHPAMLPRLPQLMAIALDAIDTDLSSRELLALTRGAIEAETVQAMMLPGRFSQPEDGCDRSYWLPDTTDLERIRSPFLAATPRNDFINNPGDRQQIVKLGALRIVLQDATGEAIDLHGLSDRLRADGSATMTHLAPSQTVRRKTEIVAQTGQLYAAQAIRAVVGCGAVTARSTGAIGSDITVYLGRDCLDRLDRLDRLGHQTQP